MFVEANNIESDKLVPTLLTIIGPDHYTLLRGLVSPQLLKKKSFDELVDILKKQYDPEPIIIAERACCSKAAGKPTRGPTRKTKWLSTTITTTTTTTTIEPAPLPEKPTLTQPDDSAESAIEESLFVVRDTSSSPPYCMELKVNDQPLTMEVDTGAAVSLDPIEVSSTCPSTLCRVTAH
jgi:hypothetical protein